MKALRFLVPAVSFATLAACNFYQEKPAASVAGSRDALKVVAFKEVYDQVIGPKCVKCHGSAGGVNLSTYANVKAKLGRVEDRALKQKTMPPSSSLSTADADLLQTWINGGALEFAPGQNPPAPSPTPSPSPSATPSVVPVVTPTFETIRTQIIEPKCLGCHGPDGQVDVGDYKTLLDPNEELVIPYNVEDSLLWNLVNRDDKRRMPPIDPESDQKLTPAELSLIKQWIEAGTPESEQNPTPQPHPKAPVLSPEQVDFSYVSKNIFAPKCARCHKEGGRLIPLVTYQEIKDALPKVTIETMVEKSMPPSRPLKTFERDILSAWIKSGAPEKAKP